MDDERTRTKRIGLRCGGGESCTSDDTGTATSTIIESSNTEWTDEKHSLYLNSIEESFVNQLYSHDYCLNDSHGWLWRTRKYQHPSGSTVNNLCSGQFKVQRRGCWEEIKFERARTQTNIENKSRTLLVNPWIKHFRSSNTGGHRHERTGYRAKSSSKKLSSCSRIVFHQESVGSNTEVSDQNFADNEWEDEKKTSRTCKKKRLKNAVTDAPGKDQVWLFPIRVLLCYLPSEFVLLWIGIVLTAPAKCRFLEEFIPTYNRPKFWKFKHSNSICTDQHLR